MTSWLIISRRQRQLGDEGGKFWSKKESLVKGKEREAKFWRKGPLHEVYNMEDKRERYRQQWRDRVNKLALLAKYDERRLQQYTAKSIERYCWTKNKIYLGNIFSVGNFLVKIHVVWKRLAIWHSFRLVWVFGREGEKREKGKTNCQKKGRRRRRRIVPTNRPRHHQTVWVGEGKRSRRPFLSTTSFGRGKKKGAFLSSVLKWRRLSYPPLQSSLLRGQGYFIPDFLFCIRPRAKTWRNDEG